MDIENTELKAKTIEEIEAEFKWKTAEKIQMSDIITDVSIPNNTINMAHQIATLIAVDLAEADLTDDVEAIDENVRQLIDLQAKLNNQITAVRSLQQCITSNETIKDILPPYNTLLKTCTDTYRVKTENEKYFKNKQYNSFKQNIWNVKHPDEAMPALVSNDDDDDIVFGSAKISLKCPLTTTWFEHPVKTKNCGHNFSKEAIMTMLRRHRQVACPIPGCNRYISVSDLEDDEIMGDRVRRAKEAEQNRQSTQQFYDVE